MIHRRTTKVQKKTKTEQKYFSNPKLLQLNFEIRGFRIIRIFGFQRDIPSNYSMHFKDFFVKIAIFIIVDVYFIKVISKAEKYFIFQLPTL